MDLSAVMTTLLSSDSVKNLSKKTGTSQSDVTSVLNSALPLLLEGATGQAKDKSTAEGFAKALMQHAEDDTSDLDSFLSNVDMEDGAKIIGHLLGSNTSGTTKKVSKASGTSSDSTAQILSAAAPLLMSLLGQETKKTSKKKSGSNELIGDVLEAVLDNVDVGSLLVGMLSGDDDSKTAAKKKTTTKKSSTSKKSTTTKKTTAKKSTAKKTTTKKKAASDNDGIDIGDVANLLTKILK